MKNIIYYSGTGKASPITFDSMFPFFNTVILFESMNDITFVINHELAHIKQNHTLKHFILTVLIGILVTIICDKILWWENWLIDIVAGQILGRMFEKEADAISIKCTSTEELYKAISMFNLMKKEKSVTGFFEKITHYMDIHPTEKDRIALIKKELIQRAKNEAQLVYLNDLNA
jgi:Zn-dependent protease with chaperone function